MHYLIYQAYNAKEKKMHPEILHEGKAIHSHCGSDFVDW
jgi:hypothetical protein